MSTESIQVNIDAIDTGSSEQSPNDLNDDEISEKSTMKEKVESSPEPNFKKEKINPRDLEIFNLYDNGPTPQEYESSQYLSTNLNRYGFIINANFKNNDDRIIDERDQIKNVAKLLTKYDYYLSKDKKQIRRAVLNGLPDCLRSQFWKQILNIPDILYKNKNVYHSLKRVARYTSKDAVQIDKDVERTCRSHVAFHVRYSVKQCELFYLLLTYSIYDKKIGYCQGMNEIAAILLMYFTEEETFWALTVLTLDEIHNLHGFYCENFPKLLLFNAHLEKTVQQFIPDLIFHFKSRDFDLKMVTTRWFLLCFINSLPFPMVLRLWDRFMLEGSLILFPTAFTIFKYCDKQLRKSELDQIAEFFKNTHQYKFEASKFFEKLDKYINKFTEVKLYPIPGVAHDAIDIDLESIISRDRTETMRLGSDSEVASTYSSIKEKYFTKQSVSSLFTDPNYFYPLEIEPVQCSVKFEDFINKHRIHLIKNIQDVDLNSKRFDIEKTSQIIKNVSKYI